jgi:hypothetical protein
MNKPNKRKTTAAAVGAALLTTVGLTASLTGNTAAAEDATSPLASGTQTHARLVQLNNSGVRGTADVTVDGRHLDMSLDAFRALKKMPHAMHIHFGAQARHECPTVRDDHNHDHRLSTAEGQPAYGPVRVSMTKRGDTSPDSTLAVNRFPTAPHGQIHYDRETRTTSRVAEAIANGKAVVVIHGLDYNGNGKYDFAGAGRSELDPTLPAEATDPVACGVLRISDGGLPTP